MFHHINADIASDNVAYRPDISNVAALVVANNIHPAALISAIDQSAAGRDGGGSSEDTTTKKPARFPLLCIVGGIARYQDLAEQKFYFVPPWTDIPGIAKCSLFGQKCTIQSFEVRFALFRNR